MNRPRLLQVLLAATLLLTVTSLGSSAIVYVKYDSPGPTFDGTSWANAYHKVQQGLDAASSGDEVWVSKGLYIENVTLKLGAGLYGGFMGTETLREQRRPRANETILDGSGWQADTVSAPAGAAASTIIDGFTIRRGWPPGGGGGVACWESSPTIANNLITENWGSGIWCARGSPIITNNIVAANSGDGIGCAESSATITNNTIVANNGDGVRCDAYSSPVVRNNIVAFNQSGVLAQEGSGSPVVWYNCVYGNARYDYSGTLNRSDNISADPQLVDRAYGNLHILPGSPCVNKGLNSAPGIPSTDIDGQTRVQDGTVDIGADEFNGTAWPPGPYAIVRVSPSGSDANDGSSWALAKQTVQAALRAARGQGGEVWVREGVYSEGIETYPYVYLYGGFVGTETARDQRNWVVNRSVLLGVGRAVVSASYSGYLVSRIDGFMIRGGANPHWGVGGGVSCLASSPIVANNLITGNAASINGIGGGIGCEFGASPTIINNTITGNTAPLGGGIGCDDSSVSWPIITNNSVFGNTAVGGGGIYSGAASPSISNNIVASNSGGGIYSTGGTPTLRNNCVYGNSGYEYSGLSAGTGDISLDPLLFDPTSGDAHLTTPSPCIDAGWGGAPGLPLTDMDGQDRIVGGVVDVGADEYPGSWTPPAVSTPIFSPEGGAYHSAPRVYMISLTPGATIRYTTDGIDPTESDPEFVNPVQTQEGEILKARAFKVNWTPSAVKSAVYTILPKLDTPTFDPGGGTYSSAQSVTINCVIPGVTIRYTVNGIDPAGSDALYSSPLLVDENLTLKARAWKTDWNTSDVATAVYVVPVHMPTFSPDGGVFGSAQSVTINCATPGATIHYTTSGIDPTESDPVYAEPVLLNASVTLKARAYKEGSPASAVKSADFQIDSSVSPGDIKTLPNEAPVVITRALVSAAFPGYFYIQADHRSSGIRVDKSGHTFTVGMRVDLSGTMKTYTHGERYILATTAAQSEPPWDTGTAYPLGLNMECLGGAAWRYDAGTGAGQMGFAGNIHLNNIGLLIRTTGLVTYSPAGATFVVSDGSRVTDASGYRGIKVIVPAGTIKPALGKHVEVTGISSMIKSGADYYPLIRVRSQSDIVVFD